MRKRLNILRFEMNVPTDVVLGSCEEVAIEGRYGPRAMFPLAKPGFEISSRRRMPDFTEAASLCSFG